MWYQFLIPCCATVVLSCFSHLAVMPKVLQGQFYNHSAQLATAQRLGTSTTAGGHTILPFVSATVFVDPPVQVGHTGNEFYLMNFDNAIPDNCAMDDLLNKEAANKPTIIKGTGVKVVKAKWYYNSVCSPCAYIHNYKT